MDTKKTKTPRRKRSTTPRPGQNAKKVNEMNNVDLSRVDEHKLFGLLTAAMRDDAEVAQRVTAHVREVTKHNTLANFFMNGSTKEDKCRLMIECLTAINKKDLSRLKGEVANGQAQGEAPAPEATPEPEVVEIPEPPKKRQSKPAVVKEVEEVVASTDPARKFVEALRELIPAQQSSAVVDETMVFEIVSRQMGGVEKSLNNHISDGVEMLKRKVEEHLANIPPRAVVEVLPIKGDKFEIDRQHYKFPLLMACLAQRIPVCLVGPAGSSKSTACQAAAKALSLPFGTINFGPTTSKADLFGYKDANGNYHSTELVRTALEGGVFCGDEFDAGHAGVATMMNMPLANRLLPTPDGTKPVHQDWVAVFAANTYGTGANRMYVGRNQMDAATLDRMVFIEWDYDEGLEASIIGMDGDSKPFDLKEGGSMGAKDWYWRVLSVREAVNKLAIRHLVTPRATIYGAKLLAAGVGLKHVEDIVLWKGLDTESVKKIKENV